MDAAELIDELKRLHAQGKDIGQHLYLRRYERSRKHSAALMLAGMQGFREMFSGSHPAKKFLRDVGLKLADTLPRRETAADSPGDGPQRSACLGYVNRVTLLSPGLGRRVFPHLKYSNFTSFFALDLLMRPFFC